MLHHLVGLLAGVALAPVLWAAAAWSADLLPRIAEGDVSVATVSSVAVLCLVGVVCAYLVASRVSPLVAGASGALLAALSLWPIAHPASMETALSWLNQDSFLYPSGTGLAVALPLGTLLLFSAAMPVRWRAATVDAEALPGHRIVASANREEYQRDGGSGFDGDPERTTTPFSRGGNGATWTPLNGGEGRKRFGRRR